jgi:hypothetical protein
MAVGLVIFWSSLLLKTHVMEVMVPEPSTYVVAGQGHPVSPAVRGGNHFALCILCERYEEFLFLIVRAYAPVNDAKAS